jgi:Icc-related predicted phosphoesterase
MKEMTIWHLTDLHIDCGKFKIKEHEYPDAKVVAITGDLHRKLAGWEFINSLLVRGYIVIYVLGNHEYHSISNKKVLTMKEIEDAWKKKAKDNEKFYFLQNESVVIDGTKFIGTTLWTDFNKEDEATMLDFDNMSDSSLIYKEVFFKSHARNGGVNIVAEDILKLHYEAKDYLINELSKEFDGEVVVLSHHAPCLESIHPEFIEDFVGNGSFASDLSSIISKFKINFWFHGHVHHTFLYLKDGTWFACNPKGYASYDEVNPLFEPFKIHKL